MSTTSYWSGVLLGMLGGAAITLCTLYLLGWRRVPSGQHAQLVPEIDRTPLRQRIAGVRARLRKADRQTVAVSLVTIAMAAAVVFGQVQVALFTSHQRACNDEFRSTSLELRRIGTEDRDLENQDDRLRNQRDDAMSALVEALVTPPAPGQRVDALGALNHYRETNAAIDVQRDRLYADRVALEQRRRAQPTPPERC